MKNILSLILIFTTTINLFSQKVMAQQKISLSVQMPNEINLDAVQTSTLESKIINLITENGIGNSELGEFVICPKLEVVESLLVETGLQNINAASVNLTLIIKQEQTNDLFSSCTLELEGSGKTKEMAITNAIRNISNNNDKLKIFLDKSSQKIVSYYETNCDNIIKKADVFVKTQKYEQAFETLMAVPVQISACYDKVQKKAIDVYKFYQKSECEKLLIQANGLISQKKYSESIEILMCIDPSTICFKEANTLVKNIENKINSEDKKNWDFQMLQYKDEVSLNASRINAIKEIAIAYAQKKQAQNNDLIIVK